MSVRLIFKKGGEFKGTCASQNPYLVKQGITCGGSCSHHDQCENKDSEVLRVLDKYK